MPPITSEPFFKILLPFIAGISLAFLVKIQHEAIPVLVLFFAALFACLSLINRRSLRYVMALSAVCLWCLMGYQSVLSHSDAFRSDRILVPDSAVVVHGWAYICEKPVKKKYFVSTVARVYLPASGDVPARNGLLELHFPKDGAWVQPVKGDWLDVDGMLQPFSSGRNFDYAGYMWRKNVFGYVKVQSRKTRVLHGANMNDKETWPGFPDLQGFGLSPTTGGFLKALLIGDRSELDPSIRRAFSDAGVIHVLALSGLHVGILFLLLSRVFSWLPVRSGWSWASLVVQAVLMWLYAWYTGFSPSVCRATTMITLWMIGSRLSRGRRPMNVLLSSAFLLLLVNPMFLFEPGFQLSYLAVGGILWLHGPLQRSIRFRYDWANKLWSLAALSLSAQLATFPLVAYYFSQFPTYFLLSNLWVVPFVAVCVYAGVGLLLMVHIPVVGGFLGEVLHGMLYLLIRGVGWMADWPGAVIRIRFDMLDVCLMYLALGLVCTYLMHGGIRKLQAGLGTILLLLLCDVVGKYAVVVNG